MNQQTTHEPPARAITNWPHDHVSTQLTDETVPECIAVTIHGVTHYLHTTTAIELFRSLGLTLERWVQQPEIIAMERLGWSNSETSADCRAAGNGARSLVSKPSR